MTNAWAPTTILNAIRTHACTRTCQTLLHHRHSAVLLRLAAMSDEERTTGTQTEWHEFTEELHMHAMALIIYTITYMHSIAVNISHSQLNIIDEIQAFGTASFGGFRRPVSLSLLLSLRLLKHQKLILKLYGHKRLPGACALHTPTHARSRASTLHCQIQYGTHKLNSLGILGDFIICEI